MSYPQNVDKIHVFFNTSLTRRCVCNWKMNLFITGLTLKKEKAFSPGKKGSGRFNLSLKKKSTKRQLFIPSGSKIAQTNSQTESDLLKSTDEDKISGDMLGTAELLADSD